MKVTLYVYALLKEKTGWDSKVVELERNYARLADILESTPELKNAILVDNDLDRHFIVLLNGRNIRLLKGLDTPIADGDRIDIFPPAGGG
ncbi:MAG: MoaD family protein [Nitrososphaerota archaeon]|nr:MoaD family protein [Nitrososphaerota archaeon]